MSPQPLAVLRHPQLQQVIDSAVRFVPRRGAGAVRVATTLVTCATAVAALNDMGAPAESEGSYHHVNVHNPRCPLFFDRHANQWACVPTFEHHPVWGINWAGAQLISRYLGGRLPSEAEWESIASDNDPARPYPWGNAAPTQLLANFGEHLGGTSDVHAFPPSARGLYDLAGNLGEWCEDAFDLGASDGRSFERVVKGGAWRLEAQQLLIRARRGMWDRLGTTTVGFRPVWDD